MEKDKNEQIQYCWDKKNNLEKEISITDINNLGINYFSNVVWVETKLGNIPYHEVYKDKEKYYLPYVDFKIMDNLYIRFGVYLSIKN